MRIIEQGTKGFDKARCMVCNTKFIYVKKDIYLELDGVVSTYCPVCNNVICGIKDNEIFREFISELDIKQYVELKSKGFEEIINIEKLFKSNKLLRSIDL